MITIHVLGYPYFLFEINKNMFYPRKSIIYQLLTELYLNSPWMEWRFFSAGNKSFINHFKWIYKFIGSEKNKRRHYTQLHGMNSIQETN